MQGNYWWTIAKNFVLGILIEYGVFLAISMAWNDKDEYYYAFLMMVGFWGIQILAWIKKNIVSAIFYYISGKRQLIDMFENDLRRNKMPIYDDQKWLDMDDYIARVAGDKRSERDQLVFAGSIGGACVATAGISGMATIRLRSTFITALERYSKNSGNLKELKRSSDDPEDDTTDDNYDRPVADEDAVLG
jgi:hypothetical protein